MSGVQCNYIFFYKATELIGGGSVHIGAYHIKFSSFLHQVLEETKAEGFSRVYTDQVKSMRGLGSDRVTAVGQ